MHRTPGPIHWSGARGFGGSAPTPPPCAPLPAPARAPPQRARTPFRRRLRTRTAGAGGDVGPGRRPGFGKPTHGPDPLEVDSRPAAVRPSPGAEHGSGRRRRPRPGSSANARPPRIWPSPLWAGLAQVLAGQRIATDSGPRARPGAGPRSHREPGQRVRGLTLRKANSKRGQTPTGATLRPRQPQVAALGPSPRPGPDSCGHPARRLGPRGAAWPCGGLRGPRAGTARVPGPRGAGYSSSPCFLPISARSFCCSLAGTWA